ncbi:unnamed protein product [Trichogramma brassicae]|uniref:Uncharacterized protein n=1 Tax=Trichogramma brassicae TaxID=86971 RepID=A0A6H5I030_9HYME|nr:unnamed protein product [Trichogramma brassicae]
MAELYIRRHHFIGFHQRTATPAAASVSVSTMCLSSSATPQSGRAESVSVPSVPSVSGLRIKSIIIVKPPRAPEKGVSHSSAKQAQVHATLTSMPPRASALRLVPARHDPGTSELARPMSLEEAPEAWGVLRSEPAVALHLPLEPCWLSAPGILLRDNALCSDRLMR